MTLIRRLDLRYVGSEARLTLAFDEAEELIGGFHAAHEQA